MRGVHLDEYQAEAALELWSTRKMDTYTIARLLRVHEAQVCRVIQAARDVTRELYYSRAGR